MFTILQCPTKTLDENIIKIIWHLMVSAWACLTKKQTRLGRGFFFSFLSEKKTQRNSCQADYSPSPSTHVLTIILYVSSTLGSSLSRCFAKDPIIIMTDCLIASCEPESGARSRNSSNTGNNVPILSYITKTIHQLVYSLPLLYNYTLNIYIHRHLKGNPWILKCCLKNLQIPKYQG